MKKIAVILSGCGVFDGSEVNEAVLSLLYLDQAGADVTCFAPDIPLAHVVNHLTGEVSENESRNVLVESARISRGSISNILELNADEFDGLVIPGGFGAAKNLCNFAFEGANLSVNDQVERVIKAFHSQKKPIGILCIAPVIGAKVLGACVTIGDSADVAAAIESVGGSHVNKAVTDIQIDEANNMVSAPAYMYDAKISEVAVGIERMVKEVLKRA